MKPDTFAAVMATGIVSIAALAGDHIHEAGLGERPVTIVTWLVATVWIPPLMSCRCDASRRSDAARSP